MDKLESVYEVYKSLTWLTLVWLHNRTNTVDREGRKTPACTSLRRELYNVVLLHRKGSTLQHYGSRGALNFHCIPVRSRALCLAVCLLNGTTCRQKSDIWQCKVWIVETLFPQAEFYFTPCQRGAGNRVGGKMHKSPRRKWKLNSSEKIMAKSVVNQAALYLVQLCGLGRTFLCALSHTHSSGGRKRTLAKTGFIAPLTLTREIFYVSSRFDFRDDAVPHEGHIL